MHSQRKTLLKEYDSSIVNWGLVQMILILWSKNKRGPREARSPPPDPPLILEEQIKTLKQKVIYIFYLHWENTIFSRE